MDRLRVKEQQQPTVARLIGPVIAGGLTRVVMVGACAFTCNPPSHPSSQPDGPPNFARRSQHGFLHIQPDKHTAVDPGLVCSPLSLLSSLPNPPPARFSETGPAAFLFNLC